MMRRPFSDTSGDEGADLFAAINVTPFVDVMLVLLVVFMVVAPLMVRGLPLNLPTGTGRPLGRPVKPTIVSVARDGTVAIGDTRIPPGMLDPTLAAGPKPSPDAVAYVRADRQVPYGDVVAIIGVLASHGYAHVSLLDRPLRQR